MLLLATLLWGLSFPTMKALTMVQQELLPGGNNWFFAATGVTIRFGLSALVIFFVCLPTLRQLTRSEIWQGLGLGAFNAVGILLQVDGLNYTSASVSAFLTQGTCLLIPLWVALRDRKWPTPITIVCCVVVVVGVGILARVDLRDVRLGRGELETLLCSVFFTAQILWLERPAFAPNRVMHFSLIMFGSIALITLPVVCVTMQAPRDIWTMCQSPAAGALTGALVVFCTLGAYVLMNKYQPFVAATKAGVIYCAEPVFASLFALFLPGLISLWAAIQYPNEKITGHLLLGGALITGANILIQTQRSAGETV